METKLKKHYSDKCVVCFEPNPSFIFVPCGHICICKKCSDIYERKCVNNSKICPLCREEYAEIKYNDTMRIMKAENFEFPAFQENYAMFTADIAPEWVDGDKCNRCRSAFGTFLRKHNCRACGQVFCGQCAGKTSTIPTYGIEKEVRVCNTCYDQVNKPNVTTMKKTDLPAEYLTSSLAQQQQVPPRKTDEIRDEEELLQIALALSQSEAEHKEKEKKRVTSAIISNATAFSKVNYSPPPPDTMRIMKAENFEFPAFQENYAMFTADISPEWVDGDKCNRCRSAFGTFLRKHNCRACGQVFCGQCAGKTSTIPKYGIEKEVRVCNTCYDQVNKPNVTTTKKTDLPAEYLTSSLAQQQQVPPRKTYEIREEEELLQIALALSQSEAEHKEKEKKRVTSAIISNSTAFSKVNYSPPPPVPPRKTDEIREEEELLQIALALSQSEAEHKEKEKKRVTSAIISNSTAFSNVNYSPSPSPSPSLSKVQEEEVDWEQRQTALEEQTSRLKVSSPFASPMPQKVIAIKQQNRKVQIAQKLEIMLKKKQEYSQYQRQLPLSRIQEQKREMQMRQEQQKQQYKMSAYSSVSGFINPPMQGSPVRQVNYSGPEPQYNPMTTTNPQAIYVYPSGATGSYSTGHIPSSAQPGSMPPLGHIGPLPQGMMPPHMGPNPQSGPGHILQQGVQPNQMPPGVQSNQMPFSVQPYQMPPSVLSSQLSAGMLPNYIPDFQGTSVQILQNGQLLQRQQIIIDQGQVPVPQGMPRQMSMPGQSHPMNFGMPVQGPGQLVMSSCNGIQGAPLMNTQLMQQHMQQQQSQQQLLQTPNQKRKKSPANLISFD